MLAPGDLDIQILDRSVVDRVDELRVAGRADLPFVVGALDERRPKEKETSFDDEREDRGSRDVELHRLRRGPAATLAPTVEVLGRRPGAAAEDVQHVDRAARALALLVVEAGHLEVRDVVELLEIVAERDARRFVGQFTLRKLGLQFSEEGALVRT